MLHVALRHPLQLRDEDVVRVWQEESDFRRGRDRVDASSRPPVLRCCKGLRRPDLHVGAVAVVVPRQLTHQGPDDLPSFGRVAPDVDLPARGSVGQPEGKGTTPEDDQFASLKEASRVAYDARDIFWIDQEIRLGKG